MSEPARGHSGGDTASKGVESSIPAQVERWRRSVVGTWIATMAAAGMAGFATALWRLPPAVEWALGVALFVVGWAALWNTHRGRCPGCRATLRFTPRIGLPDQCPGCGVRLRDNPGATERA